MAFSFEKIAKNQIKHALSSNHQDDFLIPFKKNKKDTKQKKTNKTKENKLENKDDETK